MKSAAALEFQIPTIDVDTTLFAQYISAVYLLVPVMQSQCDTALEIYVKSTLCTQLTLPNCSYVDTACVHDNYGSAGQAVPFYPTDDSNPGGPIIPLGAVEMAVQFLIDEQTNNVQLVLDVFQETIALSGWTVGLANN